MKTKHTPGPWEAKTAGMTCEGDPEKDCATPLVASLTTNGSRGGIETLLCVIVPKDNSEQIRPSTQRGNAARIVSCVNACEGINPEAVPDMLGTLREVLEWHEKRNLGERSELLQAVIRDTIHKATEA